LISFDDMQQRVVLATRSWKGKLGGLRLGG